MPPKRNLLTTGFDITLRQWPALVWTYVFNLGLAILFSLPLHSQLAAITANSFASQSLTNGFDLPTLGEVSIKAAKDSGPALGASHLAIPVYLLIYFLIVPGTLFCYQTGTRAKLGTLLQTGLQFFWRFVRITLYNLLVSAIILVPLLIAKNFYGKHIDETIVGRSAFLHNLTATIIVLLVAAVIRVYFDLVEVYTVQLSSQLRPATAKKPERQDKRIYRTLLPALKTLWRNLFRTYFTFILLSALGFFCVYITTRTAMHSLAKPSVFPQFLLAQIGLFILLATRFWQRGAETTLVLDNPLPLPILIEPTTPTVTEIVVIEATTIEPIPAQPEPSLEAPPTEDPPAAEPA